MTNPTKRNTWLWLYLPWAIAAIVVAGYFVLWRVSASEMKKAVEIWVEDQRAAGMVISHGMIHADGFPFFLRVHIENPDLADGDEWRWRTARLTLDALPYDFNRLIFSARNEQTLSLVRYGEWRIGAEDFRASIARDKKRGWVFAVTLGGAKALRVEDGATAALDSLILDISPEAAGSTTTVASVAATGASFDSSVPEIRLDSLQTVLALSHTPLLTDIGAWRGAGGALIINGLVATLDTARLSLAGEIRLDRNHFPEGQIATEASSPAAFAHALSEAGVLTAEDAERLAATLTLTAIASGGKINTPILLKDGAAHIAGVKIADLPRVE